MEFSITVEQLAQLFGMEPVAFGIMCLVTFGLVEYFKTLSRLIDGWGTVLATLAVSELLCWLVPSDLTMIGVVKAGIATAIGSMLIWRIVKLFKPDAATIRKDTANANG